MSAGPLSDYQLGKIRHLELEAEHQGYTEISHASGGRHLTLRLGSLMALLIFMGQNFIL